MHTELVRRARNARKFGIAMMLAGLMPVLWFTSRSLTPAKAYVPALPLEWVPKIAQPSYLELAVALAGFAILWLGAWIARRQQPVFEAHERDTQDRQRRVQQYGGDGRVEPYIGSPMVFRDDREPQ
jgi:hypothetical protein